MLDIFTQWYAQAEKQAESIYNVPSYIPDFQAQAVAFQESGSTVADAYAMIAALATFGTPVFEYTPSYPSGAAFSQQATPLFAVFEQPGTTHRTFAVYNTSATVFPVTFKDASGATVITVQAQPNALTTQTL